MQCRTSGVHIDEGVSLLSLIRNLTVSTKTRITTTLIICFSMCHYHSPSRTIYLILAGVGYCVMFIRLRFCQNLLSDKQRTTPHFLFSTDQPYRSWMATKFFVAMSKCKFCGSTAFGGCMNSPHGKHEHQQIGDRCVYCGSTAYGGCINSPSKKHKHESGYGRCVYCGSTAYGGCTLSPSGKHEH